MFTQCHNLTKKTIFRFHVCLTGKDSTLNMSIYKLPQKEKWTNSIFVWLFASSHTFRKLSEQRLWFLKSYIGILTDCTLLSSPIHLRSCSVSKASKKTRRKRDKKSVKMKAHKSLRNTHFSIITAKKKIRIKQITWMIKIIFVDSFRFFSCQTTIKWVLHLFECHI